MKGIERLAIATIDSLGLKADENLVGLFITAFCFGYKKCLEKNGENKRKKLTKYDLNIGDVVRSRSLGWEFIVIGISTCLGEGPTEAELTCDIEGNEGDYFIVNLDEVELVRKFNKKK